MKIILLSFLFFGCYKPETKTTIKTHAPEKAALIAATLSKAYPQLSKYETIAYAQIIYHFTCEKYAIPFEEPCAIIQIETGWDPTLVSISKCRGLGQLSTAAAAESAAKINIDYLPGITEWRDIDNLALSLEYYCSRRENGTAESATKSYIGGDTWKKAASGGDREKVINQYDKSVGVERLRIKKIMAEVEKLKYIKGGVIYYAEHPETDSISRKR